MKGIIIYNPAAGGVLPVEELHAVAAFLAEQGWEPVPVKATQGPGDATLFAREAAADCCDAVFAAGGDGTLGQVVEGLVGTETALAVLPAGTGNVFARQLHLPIPGGLHPRPLLESARLALGGQVRYIDVGRVSCRRTEHTWRHFLCWAGVGFDAQVSLALSSDKEAKRRLGLIAFVVAGFRELNGWAGTRARVRIDGKRLRRRVIMLVANNIQLYGVIFKMATTAVLDDGWLDICCFQGRSPARTLLHAIRLLFQQHLADPEVDIRRGRRIEISSSRPLPVQVDGDFLGYTPVVFEVVPRSLKLMAPLGAPADLFVDGSGLGQVEGPWQWVLRVMKDAQDAMKERTTTL